MGGWGVRKRSRVRRNAFRRALQAQGKVERLLGEVEGYKEVGSLRTQNEDALRALSPSCVKSETCCTRSSSCKLYPM